MWVRQARVLLCRRSWARHGQAATDPNQGSLFEVDEDFDAEAGARHTGLMVSTMKAAHCSADWCMVSASMSHNP